MSHNSQPESAGLQSQRRFNHVTKEELQKHRMALQREYDAAIRRNYNATQVVSATHDEAQFLAGAMADCDKWLKVLDGTWTEQDLSTAIANASNGGNGEVNSPTCAEIKR